MINSARRISAVAVIEPFRLRAVFFDGTVKEYDLHRWEDHPAFSLLFRHPALQTAVRVAPGGYGVSWNEDIDLSAEEIYWNGTDVDFSDVNLIDHDETTNQVPTKTEAFFEGGCGCFVLIAVLGILTLLLGGRVYADLLGLAVCFLIGGCLGLLARWIYKKGFNAGRKL